jgi:hypothetical protein
MKKNPKVARRGQNRPKMGLFKGGVDSFSNMDFQLFYFLTRIIPMYDYGITTCFVVLHFFLYGCGN